jgi:hypothetical protein
MRLPSSVRTNAVGVSGLRVSLRTTLRGDDRHRLRRRRLRDGRDGAGQGRRRNDHEHTEMPDHGATLFAALRVRQALIAAQRW